MPHAAIMAGGMVPSLIIALATTFFKNKFTESEQRTGIVNYIMEASFVTEGAIPFAAADPLRILPTCILGSGIADALSMTFGCQLPAPHGGIFILLLIKNWPLYLVSILIGNIASELIIGFTKRVSLIAKTTPRMNLWDLYKRLRFLFCKNTLNCKKFA